MNSSVLACNYAISGAGAGSSELSSKLASMPAGVSAATSGPKLPVIRAQKAGASSESKSEGRRTAMLCLAATLFTSAVASSSANAGVIEDYLEKSKANKVRFNLFADLGFFFFINLYSKFKHLFL